MYGFVGEVEVSYAVLFDEIEARVHVFGRVFPIRVQVRRIDGAEETAAPIAFVREKPDRGYFSSGYFPIFRRAVEIRLEPPAEFVLLHGSRFLENDFRPFPKHYVLGAVFENAAFGKRPQDGFERVPVILVHDHGVETVEKLGIRFERFDPLGEVRLFVGTGEIENRPLSEPFEPICQRDGLVQSGRPKKIENDRLVGFEIGEIRNFVPGGFEEGVGIETIFQSVSVGEIDFVSVVPVAFVQEPHGKRDFPSWHTVLEFSARGTQ